MVVCGVESKLKLPSLRKTRHQAYISTYTRLLHPAPTVIKRDKMYKGKDGALMLTSRHAEQYINEAFADLRT